MKVNDITVESCIRQLEILKSANIFIKDSVRLKAAGWDLLYLFFEQEGFKFNKCSQFTPIEQLLRFLNNKFNN